ncbi:MAG: GWxTD domain-containing protein [Gemmatimonadaceae bacterium]|nr:GWxTD domain-containing protein [Gemmatimonadaceae bacterium]
MSIGSLARSSRIVILSAVATAFASGCSGGRPGGAPAPAPRRSSLGPQEFDAVALYRRMGLLGRGAPMPFVGAVSFFASGSPDSTHVLVSIGLANASLTFAREGDRFRAGYTVAISVQDGATPVRRTEAREEVLVASFRETSRVDESVLYEELLTVPPGRYALTVSVRDDGSARLSEDDATLNVPRLGAGSLSSPVAFARATVRASELALPNVIANPAASATFGRDTSVVFFVEGYGPGAAGRVVQAAVRTDGGQLIYRDSATLALRGAVYSGTVTLPIAKVGIGSMTLSMWSPGGSDTVRAPFFVGFGLDLPLASYDEMVNYLRWFAPAPDVQALRDATPASRPAAWGAFVKKFSGADGSMEPLRDYFARMVDANARFREEASPGWMTDRGKVLLGLGRPDQVYQQMSRTLVQPGRQETWEYRNLNVVLTFYDQDGFGRWKLTPSSDAAFMAAWRRRFQ